MIDQRFFAARFSATSRRQISRAFALAASSVLVIVAPWASNICLGFPRKK